MNGATLSRADLRVAILLEEFDAIANECLHSTNAEESLNVIRTKVRNIQKTWQA